MENGAVKSHDMFKIRFHYYIQIFEGFCSFSFIKNRPDNLKRAWGYIDMRATLTAIVQLSFLCFICWTKAKLPRPNSPSVVKSLAVKRCGRIKIQDILTQSVQTPGMVNLDSRGGGEFGVLPSNACFSSEGIGKFWLGRWRKGMTNRVRYQGMLLTSDWKMNGV